MGETLFNLVYVESSVDVEKVNIDGRAGGSEQWRKADWIIQAPDAVFSSTVGGFILFGFVFAWIIWTIASTLPFTRFYRQSLLRVLFLSCSNRSGTMVLIEISLAERIKPVQRIRFLHILYFP